METSLLGAATISSVRQDGPESSFGMGVAVFAVILLVGLVHVALLLLYVPAFFIAVVVFLDGNPSQRPLVLLAWVPAVLALLAYRSHAS